MLNADIFEKVSTEEKSHVTEPEMGSAFERYRTCRLDSILKSSEKM